MQSPPPLCRPTKIPQSAHDPRRRLPLCECDATTDPKRRPGIRGWYPALDRFDLRRERHVWSLHAAAQVWLTCARIVALDSALEASQVASPLPGGTIPSEPNPDHWSRV